MRNLIGNLHHHSASIGIIGGADGPTAVYVSSHVPWATIALVAAGVAVVLGVVLAAVCAARKR